MHPFVYTKASDTRQALAAGRDGGRYLAGGTTLVDLMRETVERPRTLVDISALPLREVTVTGREGLRVGALVRMAEAAAHPKVRALHPVMSQALELSASAQLRNMATTGGNLSDILANLSKVIRERAMLRSKIRALSGEGRMSAIVLSVFPFLLAGVISMMAPDYYTSVADSPIVRYGISAALALMVIGDYIMYRMVNFEI